MSWFQFSPKFSHSYDPYVVENAFLSAEEIQRLHDYVDSKDPTLKQSTVGGGNLDKTIRSSKQYWIKNDNITTPFYQKLGDKCRQINSANFRFDLWGIIEDLQYTCYDSETQDHYTWHQDEYYDKSIPRTPRKLSLVIQLSDPFEYQGGDLELNLGGTNPHKAIPKGLGNLAVFPSWTLHRVTPVTGGTRKSLVCWVTGEPFR